LLALPILIEHEDRPCRLSAFYYDEVRTFVSA
jgi:hypothetical protein